jgi:phage-related protein
MLEMDYKIILGIVGVISAIWGVMAKIFWSAFQNHKKTVQYKDNCEAISNGIKQQITDTKELMASKFDTIEKGIEEVKDLIKNGGNPRGRVRT